MEKATQVLSNKWFLFILIALIFIAFGGSLTHGYGMDDLYVIQKNPYTNQGIEGIPSILSSKYTLLNDIEIDYRPLVLVSYALEYHFFGESPGVSHFLNLIFYCISIYLAFSYLKRIFSHFDTRLAQIITLLFALHPLHSEVVLSIKNRDEIFVAIFGFLSLIQALKYLESKKWHYLIWMTVFMFLSLISKKTGVVFLPMLLLTALYKTQSFKKSAIVIIGYLPVFLYKVINGKLIYSHNKRVMAFHENPLFIESVSFIHRIPIAINTIARYMELFLWPDPLRYYYGYDTVDFPGWTDVYVYILLLLFLGLVALAIYFWFKNKAIWAFGLIIWFSTIIIFSNLLKPGVGIIAERFVFVSIFGLCITFGYLFYSIIYFRNGKYKYLGFGLIGVSLFLMTAKNISRTQDWESEKTLYTADMPYLSNSFKAHYTFAMLHFSEYKSEKRKDQASWGFVLAHLDSAIAIHPEASALTSKAAVLMDYFSDYSEAAKSLKKALLLEPTNCESWHNYAILNQRLNNTKEATLSYEKALECDPNKDIIIAQAGSWFLSQNQTERALKLLNKGIKLHPENASIWGTKGNVHYARKEIDLALECFDRAYKLNPRPDVCKGIIEMASLHKKEKYLTKYQAICP